MAEAMKERGREKGMMNEGVRTEEGAGGSIDVPWSVHIGKGVCNAVESSGDKSQMEFATGVKRQEEDEWC